MRADRPYLRSRQRRGRWAHYYRRGGREVSLGVHGLSPDDAKVFAAYCAEHARWEHSPPEVETPKAQTFAWGLDLYLSSDRWSELSEGTKAARRAILGRYRKAQGGRALAAITAKAMQAGLEKKGGHGAINELKALKPVFAFLKAEGFIQVNPAAGVELRKPKIRGFTTATAEEIARFQARWPVGTTERLILDLGCLTGAARVDLARLSRKNIDDGLLIYRRQKSGAVANVPITAELRAVIARTPDIAPAFVLTRRGQPFDAASLGNRFAEACKAAEVGFRLHGLRKAFCCYWAERGADPLKIASMAGHLTLSEVQRYTRDADRRRIVRQLVEGA